MYLEEIRESPVVVDQWQLEKLALIGLKNEVLFYRPGVEKMQLGSIGEKTFHDLNAALAVALEELPAGARVALVPEGPYVYARLAD